MYQLKPNCSNDLIVSLLPDHYLWVGDLFYKKSKWVQGLRVLNLHAVGKLRQDANGRIQRFGEVL